MQETFRKFSESASIALGTPMAFLIALAAVVVWAISGPIFNYSETWQLVINTSTTIITFLMVFLVQATQNRDTKILNLKMDEIIRALRGARNAFVSLEKMTDDDLAGIEGEFRVLAERYGDIIDDDLATIQDELRRRRGPDARAAG